MTIWCLCQYLVFRNARVYIHIFIYKNSVILYITTPTKSLSTLLPQGLATFGFYTKHMYNLYYPPVFGAPSYGNLGVFSDEPTENRKKTGCCTHTNTPRNPPTLSKPYPLFPLYPLTILSPCPISHHHHPLYFSSTSPHSPSSTSQLQTFIVFIL